MVESGAVGSSHFNVVMDSFGGSRCWGSVWGNDEVAAKALGQRRAGERLSLHEGHFDDDE
jgi:hypothetical protein